MNCTEHVQMTHTLYCVVVKNISHSKSMLNFGCTCGAREHFSQTPAYMHTYYDWCVCCERTGALLRMQCTYTYAVECEERQWEFHMDTLSCADKQLFGESRGVYMLVDLSEREWKRDVKSENSIRSKWQTRIPERKRVSHYVAVMTGGESRTRSEHAEMHFSVRENKTTGDAREPTIEFTENPLTWEANERMACARMCKYKQRRNVICQNHNHIEANVI